MKWLKLEFLLIGLVILVIVAMGCLFATLSPSTTVSSHPSVTGLPTLELSFEGRISTVLGSLERMNDDPDWSSEVVAMPHLNLASTFIVLPEHQPTTFRLILVGQPGQDITVRGRIGSHHTDTIVPLGKKDGEAVLAVIVSAEHKIKYDWVIK